MKKPYHPVVVVNGPPRCGKDTFGEIAREKFNVRILKMAEPLGRCIQHTFNIDDRDWRIMREDGKDTAQPALFGLTPREAMISASEDWLKHLIEPGVFGHFMLRRLEEATSTAATIITDCGFREELVPLVKAKVDLFIIQLTRPGTTFEEDSRSFVDLTDLSVPLMEVDNRFDKFMFAQQVIRALTSIGLTELEPFEDGS